MRVQDQELNDPAFYSLLFLVPKATGGYRPVLDISHLNTFVDCPHFIMETVRSVRSSVRQGDWACSIDLTDAYLHVPLHRSSRKFLRLALSSTEVYCFTVLPFGLNTAPLVFTRIATAVASVLRQRGIRIHVYLDDWLVLAQDRSALERGIQETLSFLRSLGFLVNEGKSHLIPSQEFQYLGLHFNTASSRVRPADHLVMKAVSIGRNISLQLPLSPRILMRMIGLLGAIADFVHLGRLNLRPVQHWLRVRWCHRDEELDDPLHATQDLVLALRRWVDQEWLMRGVPLLNLVPTVYLLTDASLIGWGAHLGHQTVFGRWSHRESLEHINVLELRAILKAFQVFADQLCNQVVLLLTDNATCVCYLRKQGGTKSLLLSDLTLEIYQFLDQKMINLVVRHIPSRRNVLADSLSRPGPLLTEWSLDEGVFSRLLDLVPLLSIDLFATCMNFRLPAYVSPFPDLSAVAVDALSIPWDFQGIPYAFPPWKMLQSVLTKIREDRVPLVLVVAPNWPRQSWFHDLLQLSVTNALLLPPIANLLTQGHWVAPKAVSRDLHAWMLSGSPSPLTVTLAKLPRGWLQQVGLPLKPSMMVDGSCTQIGVCLDRLILSVPLALN